MPTPNPSLKGGESLPPTPPYKEGKADPQPLPEGRGAGPPFRGDSGGLTNMNSKKDVWKFVIQTVIAILTAIGTTLGVTSCMV